MGTFFNAFAQATDYFIPESETKRLEALSDTLQVVGEAVKAGDMDMNSARAAVSDAIETALDLMGGAGVGVMFAALGAWITEVAPVPIHLRGAVMGGAGVFGYMVEMTIGSSGFYEQLADAITNGIFSGAEALASVINNIADQVSAMINPFSNQAFEPYDLSYYEASPDPFDVNGVAPDYVDLAAFETTPVTEYPLYTAWTGPGPQEPPMPIETTITSVIAVAPDAPIV